MYLEVTSLPQGYWERVFFFFFFFLLLFWYDGRPHEIMEQSLSKYEGLDLRLMNEQADIEFKVATKFLTKHALNIDAIAKTFTP